MCLTAARIADAAAALQAPARNLAAENAAILAEWQDSPAPVGGDDCAQFTITPEWVLAGKAIFTVSNDKGEHYTFKVSKVDNEAPRPAVWFVSLLTGGDNERDYSYLGCLRPTTGNVDLTRASRMTDTSLAVKVVRWAMRVVWDKKEIPAGYGIDGEGRCGKCGRKLTHTDGVNNNGYRYGFGPTCWARMQGV